jgi:hypothetical protein
MLNVACSYVTADTKNSSFKFTRIKHTVIKSASKEFEGVVIRQKTLSLRLRAVSTTKYFLYTK